MTPYFSDEIATKIYLDKEKAQAPQFSCLLNDDDDAAVASNTNRVLLLMLFIVILYVVSCFSYKTPNVALTNEHYFTN